MNALMQIAERLGGDVKGDQVLAPGPGHSAADRSLSIKPDDAAPEGFLVHSFAGDDPTACRDHVREKLGLPKPQKRKGNGAGGGGAWKFIREHIYRTADGKPHLRKRKMLDHHGKHQFPQSHWAGGQWVKDVPKDWPKVYIGFLNFLRRRPRRPSIYPKGKKTPTPSPRSASWQPQAGAYRLNGRANLPSH